MMKITALTCSTASDRSGRRGCLEETRMNPGFRKEESQKEAFRRSNWSRNDWGVVLNRGLGGVVIPLTGYMQPAGEQSGPTPTHWDAPEDCHSLQFRNSQRARSPSALTPTHSAFLYPWNTLFLLPIQPPYFHPNPQITTRR